MPDLTTLAIFFIMAIALLIVLFNGMVYGAMYQRLPSSKLHKIIELGKLTHDMTVLDLGAGYGRIMFEAAKSGASVIGYEIDPSKVYWIQQQIKRKMFRPDKILNISVVHGNLLDVDLSNADVVYCYLSPPLMQKLGVKAVKEMRVGSRIISVEHKIDGLKPTLEDKTDKIYMYTF